MVVVDLTLPVMVTVFGRVLVAGVTGTEPLPVPLGIDPVPAGTEPVPAGLVLVLVLLGAVPVPAGDVVVLGLAPVPLGMETTPVPEGLVYGS